MWIYTGNKLAKFHGNILSLSKNIAKSFFFGGGATFFDSHCICRQNQLSRLESNVTIWSSLNISNNKQKNKNKY